LQQPGKSASEKASDDSILARLNVRPLIDLRESCRDNRRWALKNPTSFFELMGFGGVRVGIGGWGFDSAPKPLEIYLSDFVVRRIDTYVEDFCDGIRIHFTADLAWDDHPVRECRC
jgi:hypothetical protein